MRPSTYTCEPFFRNSPATSARRPKKAMRCHSVASFISPLALSFHLSVVATRMLVTASPLGRYLVSGSAPRLPTMITLFTDAMSHPSYEPLCLAQRAAGRLVDVLRLKTWRRECETGYSSKFIFFAGILGFDSHPRRADA